MENKELYRKIAVNVFEAMNLTDFSVYEEHADENLSFDFPGVDTVKGVKRVILFFKVLLRKYNNLKFTVITVIVENNKACVVWTNKGEEKDGSEYTNSGITLFHFEKNKVVYISDYFKNTSFINHK